MLESAPGLLDLLLAGRPRGGLLPPSRPSGPGPLSPPAAADPPDQTSAYCQARGGLPLERLDDLHRAVVGEAEAGVATADLWCGLRVHVVDGTTATAPDTPDNQHAYPQQKVQRPGCGFPIIRIVALFALATGMITGWVTGAWGQHELALFQQLWEELRPGELLLGDRGFCSWGLLAQCQARQIHAVFRVRGSRRRDLRRGKALGPGQRLVRCYKPPRRLRTISAEEWAWLPQFLDLRLVRCYFRVPGFRTRQVLLVIRFRARSIRIRRIDSAAAAKKCLR